MATGRHHPPCLPCPSLINAPVPLILLLLLLFPCMLQVYVTILSGYMYGALWAYSTVFAASFR